MILSTLDPRGPAGAAGGAGTTHHAALDDVTADQHHAKLHHADHAAGGPDPVTLTAAQISDLAATINAAISALVAGAPGALDTLNELATAINDDASFAATVTTALGLRLQLPAAVSAGRLVTEVALVAWVSGECYELTALTRDANDVVTSAVVKWPDGSAGLFTTTTINATWFAIDAFTVTHTQSGKTVTQALVTRDATGAVTVKPALAVA